MKKNKIPAILIVEDDQDLRIFYSEILMYKGFNVIGCVRNSKEGLKRFNTLLKKIDIIIIDYSMCLKNGIQIIKEFLKFDENAKIILISAESEIEEKAYRVGAIGFLLKSFTINELITEINFVLIDI